MNENTTDGAKDSGTSEGDSDDGDGDEKDKGEKEKKGKDKGDRGERNPKQDKKLTRGDIEKLKNNGIDPEELKGGKSTGKTDLYKDRSGNIYVKPKGGGGEGDPTGINLRNL